MKLTMKRIMLAFLMVVVVFAAFACKKNQDDPKPDPTPTTAEITLAKASYTLEVGDQVTLADKVTEGFELEYSVDKADVLKLEGNKVTAQKAGVAVVTVTVKGTQVKATINVTVEEKVVFTASYTNEEDYKAYVDYDLDLLYDSMVDELTAEQKVAVDAKYAEGKAAIAAAKTLEGVQDAYKAAEKAMAECVPLASGLLTYMTESNERKTEILGVLENYAITTGTTGISLFENGGYVMYNPRVTLGTETFITGYGFGVLAEGNLTAPLEYETNEAWKMYYHTFNAADPGTANYLNDQGAEVGDFYGYFGASYYTTFMNETKNGYNWVPLLAITERPEAMDEDYEETGFSAKWRFEVRTGKTGLKYNTNSTLRAKYNNRDVELEDYLTAFKLLLTKKNALYRGGELAQTKSYPIVGAKEYYEGSEEGFNEELWANVGLKVYEEDGKEYFEYTFGKVFTQFNAMYYISSILYMPVPQEFLDEVTVENYLSFNKEATETPVDNALSLGAYTLEKWDTKSQVVYKKNPNYVYANEKYKIQGIVITILEAAKDDPTAGIKEFLAEHIDAAGIPQDFLDQYKNDPRTRQTTGDSNFKLNVNATDEATWEYLFGTNGVITQTDKADYWDVKPCLSNKHFVRGLSYSIDRLTFAAARGSVPAVNFFSSDYMSDNENGFSYNGTDAHKKAVNQLLEDTEFGYSLTLAQDYFKMALDELEAAGAYTPGTKENPTVITLEIAWMYPQHETNYHNEIKKYLEDAFNDEAVSGGKYKLVVEFWVGDIWSDVYYNKMMVGQYDIGFGSVSGDSLNPLAFMNVLSTDKALSNGFTLNFGCDTNDVESYPIVFDGKRWSYDGLYVASQQVAIIDEGTNKPVYVFDFQGLEADAEGNYVGTATFTLTLPDKTDIEVTDVALCNYGLYYGTGNDKYEEFYLKDFAEGYTLEQSLSADGKVLTVTVKVSKEIALELYQHYADVCAAAEKEPEADYIGYMGFDFYYAMTFNGADSEGYESINDYFEGLLD